MWVASFVTYGEHLDISVHYSRMFKNTNTNSQVLLLLVDTWTLVSSTAEYLKALMWVASFVTSGGHLDFSVHYSRMFKSTNVNSQFCYFWWILGHITNCPPSLNFVKFAPIWDDIKMLYFHKERKKDWGCGLDETDRKYIPEAELLVNSNEA